MDDTISAMLNRQIHISHGPGVPVDGPVREPQTFRDLPIGISVSAPYVPSEEDLHRLQDLHCAFPSWE